MILLKVVLKDLSDSYPGEQATRQALEQLVPFYKKHLGG